MPDTEATRIGISRLWWPGYLDLGAREYAATVAEDGWHMFDINEDGSYVQVGDEYQLAWDHSPAQSDGTGPTP